MGAVLCPPSILRLHVEAQLYVEAQQSKTRARIEDRNCISKERKKERKKDRRYYH